MPYVMRDDQGKIIAVSQVQDEVLHEQLPGSDPELIGFLNSVGDTTVSLGATDQGFVRVLEDLINVLVEKDVILFADLPEDARKKILDRQRLRSELRSKLAPIADQQC